MRVHLLTHAHTRQQPEVDSRHWELSEQGAQQAAALIQAPIWTHVTALVVSSEPKTRLTAEPVAEYYKLPIYTDVRFDELQRGGWIEDYAATVAAVFAAPDRSIAGWETAQSALQRALDALRDWEQRFENGEFGAGEIAIFGHGLSLSLVRAWFRAQTAIVRGDLSYGDLSNIQVDIDEWQRLPFGAWATVDTQRREIVQDFVLGDKAR